MANLQSDIRILEKLLALNLNISLWSARKKMTPEDFGGVELPPDDLASLGSKRIADPDTLKIFSTLKSRIFSYLDRHGVRFMSGWAIPEDKADIIVDELVSVRDEFMKAKSDYLSIYEESLETWIAKHQQWASIIRDSMVSADYVRARMDFRWQLYKVAPLMRHENMRAVSEAGLANEVENLGGTLFEEISKAAQDMWKRVFAGKNEVTHKALSPLKTLQAKLEGLSFVEPHVAPVAEIIVSVLNRIPKRGVISGTDLLMLQGVVCLLKDRDALVEQTESLITGISPESVLNSLLAPDISVTVCEADMGEPQCTKDLSGAVDAPEIIMPASRPVIPSMGLW